MKPNIANFSFVVNVFGDCLPTNILSSHILLYLDVAEVLGCPQAFCRFGCPRFNAYFFGEHRLAHLGDLKEE